jgi:hypothetical protein
MDKLVIMYNGTAEVEYDRGKPLQVKQREFLDKTDQNMNAGIYLGNDFIEQPDVLQRAQVMAGHLVQALKDDNEQVIAMTTAYLATRLPELKQVKITEQDDTMVDLVFDEQRTNQVPVNFYWNDSKSDKH